MHVVSGGRGSLGGCCGNLESDPAIPNDKMSLLSDDCFHQAAAASLQAETTSTNSKSNIRKQTRRSNTTHHEPAFNGGFSFGKRSISFEPSHSVCHEENGNDIGEIYGLEMKELTSFKEGVAVTDGRRAIAQRIGRVGYIAQNLSLGHVFVSQADDAGPKPNPVKLEVSEYIVDDDSPMQIDVKWNKPENADEFKSLAYKIDIKPESSSDDWTTVSCVRFPVFRVYHTDDKLLVGKVHLSRQSHDLIYVLRCKVLGEVNHNSVSCLLESEWSQNVTLVFCGYRAKHKNDVFFNL